MLNLRNEEKTKLVAHYSSHTAQIYKTVPEVVESIPSISWRITPQARLIHAHKPTSHPEVVIITYASPTSGNSRKPADIS